MGAIGSCPARLRQLVVHAAPGVDAQKFDLKAGNRLAPLAKLILGMGAREFRPFVGRYSGVVEPARFRRNSALYSRPAQWPDLNLNSPARQGRIKKTPAPKENARLQEASKSVCDHSSPGACRPARPACTLPRLQRLAAKAPQQPIAIDDQAGKLSPVPNWTLDLALQKLL
jgi:hypothetical protein